MFGTWSWDRTFFLNSKTYSLNQLFVCTNKTYGVSVLKTAFIKGCFFVGQLLTYVYAVEDDGTKQTTEATVQDLVHSGIKISYKDSAGKLFTEVVKFGKCKEKLIVSSSDPDRYDHLSSGIVLNLLCIFKKRTSETKFP